MTRFLTINNKTIEYNLIRKNVKNINLRIKKDCSITVSANFFVSSDTIEKFLISKSDFIINALNKFANLSNKKSKGNFYKVCYLGKKIDIKVIQDKKNFYKYNDDLLVIYVNDIYDIEKIRKVFHSWLRSECEKVISHLCDRYYVYFSHKNVSFPALKFRNMKSRWGSCNIRKNILTFNTRLITVPLECIEYVVVHEFAHFLVPNHSKNFYKLVEEILPDYMQRRKTLSNFEN